MPDIEITTDATMRFRMPHCDFDFKVTYLEEVDTISIEAIRHDDHNIHVGVTMLIDDLGHPIIRWEGPVGRMHEGRQNTETIQFSIPEAI